MIIFYGYICIVSCHFTLPFFLKPNFEPAVRFNPCSYYLFEKLHRICFPVAFGSQSPRPCSPVSQKPPSTHDHKSFIKGAQLLPGALFSASSWTLTTTGDVSLSVFPNLHVHTRSFKTVKDSAFVLLIRYCCEHHCFKPPGQTGYCHINHLQRHPTVETTDNIDQQTDRD